MLSQKEATEKWCPFARAADGGGAVINRDWAGLPDKKAICISARCMAWRWEDRRSERGYCGMAGKPVVP
jgi:hypothetical protein